MPLVLGIGIGERADDTAGSCERGGIGEADVLFVAVRPAEGPRCMT
jgi:hypothetical protein